MLGSRRARPAGSAELLGQRQVGLDHAVAGFGMAVAAADGGRGCGIEGFDLVHGFSLRLRLQ